VREIGNTGVPFINASFSLAKRVIGTADIAREPNKKRGITKSRL